MLCKCNKGTDNSRKEMDKFNIYDLSETPMMLASNIRIKSKEDVIKIARGYINRWLHIQ